VGIEVSIGRVGRCQRQMFMRGDAMKDGGSGGLETGSVFESEGCAELGGEGRYERVHSV
jgi:hypothetical protein